MLNIRIDSYIDRLEGASMSVVAMIFLLLFVVLIGGVILLVVVSGVGNVCNSIASLIESLDDFIHRDAQNASPLVSQKSARYLP